MIIKTSVRVSCENSEVLGALPARILALAVQASQLFHALAESAALVHAAANNLTLVTPVQGEGWAHALLIAGFRAGAQFRRTIAPGTTHTLWIEGGRAYASGANPDGYAHERFLLGQEGADDAASAMGMMIRPVIRLANVAIVEVAVGIMHSLALSSTGTVFSFGTNAFGQLGSASCDAQSPHQVLGLKHGTARRVSCGSYYSMVIDACGALYTFGANHYGQLCRHTDSSDGNLPTLADDQLPRLQQAAGGRAHTLLLTLAGRVYAAGRNEYGQLGDGCTSGSPTADPSPTVHVGLQSRIAQVACGQNHSLAVSNTGEVWSWGCDEGGQIITGAYDTRTPVPASLGAPGSVRILQVVAGIYHSVLLSANGDVYLVGRGCPRPGSVRSEADVEAISKQRFDEPLKVGMAATQIYAGARNTIVANGASPRVVHAWGAAREGQCGFQPDAVLGYEGSTGIQHEIRRVLLPGQSLE